MMFKNIKNEHIVFVISIFFIFVIGIFNLLIKKTEAAAPKIVYYSVGQNINDHKTGSPTVTISNGLATFSVPQTAINMGVGDRVVYGSSNSVFISGKISTTQWNVVTVNGNVPANITNSTVTQIRHEFASLNDAVSYYTGTQWGDAFHLNTTNLVTGNYILNIPLYYDTGPENFVGGGLYAGIILSDVNVVTGPNNYIRIYTPFDTTTEVNQSQRHSGKWNDQKYSLVFTPNNGSTSALRVYIPYVKIDGLQINLISNQDGNSAIEGSYINGGWIEISNNIIKGQIQRYASGIYVGYQDNNTVGKIYNNLIYDLASPAFQSSSCIIFGDSYNTPYVTGTGYVYNNTVVNCEDGIHNNDSTGATVLVAKNNIVQDANSGFGGTGSISPLSDCNVSNQNDAPGANSKNNATVTFVNKAAKDFHLSSSDTIARNNGCDLSADPNITISGDIDEESRQLPWDIGSDEFYANPPNNPTITPLSAGPYYANNSYSYNFNATDNSGYRVRYRVDWDNNSGTTDEWLPADINGVAQYVNSGTSMIGNHSWPIGVSTFRALTQNEWGINSGWTTATVTTTGAPVVTISASNPTAADPFTSSVTYTTTNSPTSCTASSNPVLSSWNGSKSTSDATQDVTNIMSQTTLTITCTNASGSDSRSTTVSPNAAGFYNVSVSKATGGRIVSDDGIINCGTTCSNTYAKNSSITLTAIPSSSNWKFVGWTGACSGTGSCALFIDSNKSVGGLFYLVAQNNEF